MLFSRCFLIFDPLAGRCRRDSFGCGCRSLKFAIGIVAVLLVNGCKDDQDVASLAIDLKDSSTVANLVVGEVKNTMESSALTRKELPDQGVSAAVSLLISENMTLGKNSGGVLPGQNQKTVTPIYSSPSEVVGLIRSFSPNGEILNIDISADGKAVVFESGATNLVRGDTNQTTDVFLLLVEHRLLKRISVDSSGEQVVGNSVNPRISPDGGWVVYESSAKGLDTRDNDQFKDIYLYEIGTGRTTLVSVSMDGETANRDSGKPVVSRNADTIAFESEATNLVEDDDNKSSDVFVYNRLLESVKLVSSPVIEMKTDANQGNLASYNPDLSEDGIYVTFESFSGRLTLDDYNPNSDVFLHNLVSQTTTLISKLGTSGAVVPGDSTNPSLSADGSTVVFQSRAQFFETDLNEVRDAYIYDVLKNELTKLPAEELITDKSVSFAGSSRPIVSGDGSVVVYEISLLANEKKDGRPAYGRHLAYYEVKDMSSSRIDLFKTNNTAINDILDYSVSLSSDAEVLAFHVSRMDDLLIGQIAPKSAWLAKKQDI